MPEKIPLSVAIITKNEGQNLPDCLKSIEFAAQVVVVDSGSTDGTVQIASQFGCEVFIEPWRGFGPQKQSAIDKCRYPWVLVLDADERIPAETASLIKKIVLNPSTTAAGFTFPRKNYFQGRWVKHMGLWPDRILRLFRKGLGRMIPAKVHESIVVDPPVEDLEAPIEHYPADQFSKILMKIDQYSTLGAQQAYEKGGKTSLWSAAFRAKLTFVQNYFIRFGFLDGVQGLTLAITDAVNKFFKYAKLNELNRKK
ncbi:MAG: glycosyltransferase family 2 protein [Thermodesulfobacteriota bacterium]|nr:glycosyltransferase family 2 protein [Thermodesulfobacteriota bacterium]